MVWSIFSKPALMNSSGSNPPGHKAVHMRNASVKHCLAFRVTQAMNSVRSGNDLCVTAKLIENKEDRETGHLKEFAARHP